LAPPVRNAQTSCSLSLCPIHLDALYSQSCSSFKPHPRPPSTPFDPLRPPSTPFDPLRQAQDRLRLAQGSGQASTLRPPSRLRLAQGSGLRAQGSGLRAQDRPLPLWAADEKGVRVHSQIHLDWLYSGDQTHSRTDI